MSLFLGASVGFGVLLSKSSALESCRFRCFFVVGSVVPSCGCVCQILQLVVVVVVVGSLIFGGVLLLSFFSDSRRRFRRHWFYSDIVSCFILMHTRNIINHLDVIMEEEVGVVHYKNIQLQKNYNCPVQLYILMEFLGML